MFSSLLSLETDIQTLDLLAWEHVPLTSTRAACFLTPVLSWG